MKICVCIPSRGRPQFMERLLDNVFSKSAEPHNVIVKYYLNNISDDLLYDLA